MESGDEIVRRLDDQWKLGLWDADIALPFLVCLFLAYASGTSFGWLTFPAIGLFLSRKMARIKAHSHDAIALHWAYWNLPVNPATALRATPPSHYRRMVG